MTSVGLSVAIDNDLVIKACAYAIAGELWPDGERMGILDQARFVAPKRLKRLSLRRPVQDAVRDFEKFLDAVELLNPTPAEVQLAAELEAKAVEVGLGGLDTGEAQLTAIVVQRGAQWLETGDKRAIAALDGLLDAVGWLAGIHNRVRCLEQVALEAFNRAPGPLASRICDEPEVDKALSYSFGCFSSSPPSDTEITEGLSSYIRSVRASAPRTLWSSVLPEKDGVRLAEARDQTNVEDGSRTSG